MHHHQRLRRPRERDVEAAEALVLLGDRGRLDDDHVVELEALRAARRQQRNPVVERGRGREPVGRLHQIARGDHREQPLLLRQP